MMAEVKTKRLLPSFWVRILPVMFWIQLSVPSSTAPINACAMNKVNSSHAPIENRVMTARIISSTPAMPYATRREVPRL
jgi:hypothetical protein